MGATKSKLSSNTTLLLLHMADSKKVHKHYQVIIRLCVCIVLRINRCSPIFIYAYPLNHHHLHHLRGPIRPLDKGAANFC
ncbi:hypothetical protein GDO78_010929 [Eleutherodactylus coqui]|uniref:Uncharacterized protein n=1 Tax=Eleutherodactylus coqui TaxID=57060 RepID=A0A8J6K5V2_ELECQ|nr:hypothetical protein GDO78_010929 [Eleutherodactylus coqui]